MTKNYKPGELPGGFEEQLQNGSPFALLVADQNLSRPQVLARIEDAAGVDLSSAQSGHLTQQDLARLVHHLDDDARPADCLSRHYPKRGLAQMVADAAGANIEVDDGQDGFRKQQAIQVWFAIHADISLGDSPDSITTGDYTVEA
jgi:hypothetical protein